MPSLKNVARDSAGVSLILLGAGIAFVGAVPMMVLGTADVLSGDRMKRLVPRFVRRSLATLPMPGMVVCGFAIGFLDPKIDSVL